MALSSIVFIAGVTGSSVLLFPIEEQLVCESLYAVEQFFNIGNTLVVYCSKLLGWPCWLVQVYVQVGLWLV